MVKPRTDISVFSKIYFQDLLIFENWKLEIKENYNSYIEIGWNHPSLSENYLKQVCDAAVGSRSKVRRDERRRRRTPPYC